MPPFVSDNHFELAGRHVREIIEPPSQRGSSLGPAGDPLLLRLLDKSTSDRLQNVDEALRAIDDLHTVMFPKIKPKPSSAPILGDASLLRYSIDASLSLVAFPHDLRSVEDTDESIIYRMSTDVVEHTLDMCVDPDRSGSAAELERVPSSVGKYVIIGRLGRGGMSEVYLGLDENLQRKVAIKLVAGVAHHVPECKLASKRRRGCWPD